MPPDTHQQPRPALGDGPPRAWRGRELLVGTLLLNLVVAALCGALLRQSWQQQLGEAQTQTRNLARLIELNLSASLDKGAIALDALASQIEHQLAWQAEIDRSQIWSLLDVEAGRLPEFQRLGVFDAQGRQRCGPLARNCQQLDIADRDYFQQLRQQPDRPLALYGPYPSKVDGQPALVLARALREAGGRFAGVAIAVLPTQALSIPLAQIDLGRGGAVALLTPQLQLLLRQPAAVAAAGTEPPPARMSDELVSAIRAQPAEGSYRATSRVDGVERQTVYRRLPAYPLYVVVGLSITEFLADWRRTASWTAAFFVLFAGATSALAVLLLVGLRHQARLRQLYDEAPCGYHTLDGDGLYRSINATELGWLGCSRDEVVGRLRPTDFMTAEGRATFARCFPQLQQTGRIDDVEVELVSRDGTVRQVLVNALAVRDRQGHFEFSNSVMHDITELHQARQRLLALSREQGAMLDTDLIGIIKLRGHQAVWKNHGMDRLFGYTGDEWKAMPARQLYPDEPTCLRVGREAAAVMQAGGHFRTQLQMVRKGGELFWVDVSCMPLSSERDETLVLLADITALKQGEAARVQAAALEARNAELVAANRLKDEFLASMSHELRTPLNAVLGYAHLLQGAGPDPDARKTTDYAGRIVHSGRHLLQLIESLLDMAQASSGRIVFRPTPVNLASALHEVVEARQARIHERRLRIEILVASALGPVSTDPQRLHQVVLTLLDNAIKFSHEGGTIALRALADGDDHVRLEVEDWGIGIAAQDLPRLFGQFQQLSTGLARRHEGAGLGLALVRSLVEAQGGTVGVRSHPGQGSLFHIRLPRRPPTGAPVTPTPPGTAD